MPTTTAARAHPTKQTMGSEHNTPAKVGSLPSRITAPHVPASLDPSVAALHAALLCNYWQPYAHDRRDSDVTPIGRGRCIPPVSRPFARPSTASGDVPHLCSPPTSLPQARRTGRSVRLFLDHGAGQPSSAGLTERASRATSHGGEN